MENFRNATTADGVDDYAFIPVWRRIILQLVISAGFCGVVVLVGEVIQPKLDGNAGRIAALSFVFVPVLLWLLWSVLPEFRSARPRRRLIGVAVISGLTASAIGLPVVEDFFRIDQWLPLQSVISRILGYSLSVGMVDTGLKFIVLRYSVYPQALRVRSDTVAYAFASAIGYSFYLNLALVWRLEPTFELAALYVLANVTVQLSSALFIALGIVESYFSDAFPLVLPTNLLIAAASSGLIASLFGGLMSGPLDTAGNADRPLFGLGVLCAALVATSGIVFFLYSNSERREREAFLGSGVSDGI